MTKAELAELRRLWGRGIAYQQLVALDLSEADYQSLVEAYVQAGFLPLGWNQRRRMWFLQRVYNVAPGEAQVITYRSGDLGRFLDVAAMVAEFDAFRERTRNRGPRQGDPTG